MATESPLRRKLRHRRQRAERALKRLGSGLAAYATWPIWTEARCLFVLSTGRTGTKTLARLLDLSEEIDAFHEPLPQLLKERQAARWEVYENEWKYRYIFSWARGTPLLRAVWNEQVYAETSPRLTFFAPVIADLIPGAKFLFVHRNPYDVIRSGMKRGWYVDHPADYARVRPVEGGEFFGQWEDMSPFEKICWYWRVYNDFAISFCEQTSSAITLSVQASEMFDGTVVPRIFDFIGVRSPASNAVENVLSKKLNAQQKGTFPKAEEWSRSMHRTLLDIAGGTMERLSYSPHAAEDS